MKRSVPLVLKFLLVVSIAFAFLTVGEGVYRAYHKSVRRVRETELMQDVSHVRQCINNYTQDRQQPPQSLQDLVDGNYLPEIPTDPLTEKKDWVPHFGTVVLGNGRTAFGIDNAHSSSEHNGCDARRRLSYHGALPEVALRGTVLLFLVPQVPNEFDRRRVTSG